MKRIRIGHKPPTTFTITAPTSTLEVPQMNPNKLMNELQQVLDAKNAIAQQAVEQVLAPPVQQIPPPVPSPIITGPVDAVPVYDPSVASSVDSPVNDLSTVSITSEPQSEMSKDSLDNSDINDLLGVEVDMSEFEARLNDTMNKKIKEALASIPQQLQDKNVEYKSIPNLVVKARETARFTFSTQMKKPIQGFNFETISSVNMVCTKHIEKIEGNKISVIVNNLSNKVVTFSLLYIASF